MSEKIKAIGPWLLLAGVYLLTRVIGLTQLPVFADESIYIRWAQLIIDDGKRYLFFPLNDGKTPLFIWQIVPMMQVVADPLAAGRLVSVLSGLAQLLVVARITWLLTKNQAASRASALLIILLPFWFFHQRMALMDAWLTFWVSLSVLASLEFLFSVAKEATRKRAIYWCLISFSVGAALWTKLPALLTLPMLILLPLLTGQYERRQLPSLIIVWLKLFAAIIFGLLLFFLLKLNPAFSQLFARGSDFLYSPSAWISGGWLSAISRWPKYVGVFFYYLTPLGSLLPLIGLFTKRRKTHFWLILMSLSYVLPIALLGKVVYPRYFLPSILPLTISMALLLTDFVQNALNTLELRQRIFWSVSLVLVALNLIAPSTQFWFYAYFDADHLPLVPEDVSQYQREWSSGHGIKQTVELMLKEAKTSKLAVATEGYFGTLPDGILMYLHRKDVNNLYVEGIGQPVKSIPESFWKRAEDFSEVWLVVNSHRLEMIIPQDQLVAEFCRPNQAPCLQVWRLPKPDTS